MSFLKKTLFLSFFFALLFLGAIYFWYQETLQSEGDLLPPKQTEEIVQLNKRIENTSLPEAKIVDDGTYLIQEGQKKENSSNPNFAIYYYKDTGEYSIILLEAPLERTRQEAETSFVNQLAISNITKEELCQLFVTVGTIASVDQINSGRDFGLSFCPGAKEFE